MWATSLLFFHFTSYLHSLLLGATTAARLVKKHVQHARSHSPRHVPFLVRVKAAAQPCQSDFLAARRAQQVHRYFVQAQPLGCVPVQFLRHLLTPCSLYSDVSHNLLTIDGIRTTNSSDLAHRCMPQEHFLNFARRDVFTPAINHLAQTALDEQVPILVQVSQVTSPKPSILKCLLPCVVLIRANHTGSGDADFAHFTWHDIAQHLPVLISPGVTDAQCYVYRAPCRARLMDTWRYWISNHLTCGFG